MIDRRRGFAVFLGLEWFFLVNWISRVAFPRDAEEIAAMSFAQWVHDAMHGMNPPQGSYAWLYRIAYNHMLELGLVGEPVNILYYEDNVAVPQDVVLENFASVWGLLYQHALHLNLLPDEIDMIASWIYDIRLGDEPESVISEALDRPGPRLAEFLRQFDSWDHPEESCNVLCEVAGRLVYDQRNRGLTWAKPPTSLIKEHFLGSVKQDRRDLAARQAHAEPALEGDRYVRRPGAQPSQWSATGPTADYRHDS